MTDSILGALIVPNYGKYYFEYGHHTKFYIPSVEVNRDDINIYNLSNSQTQEIALNDFNRSLKEDENDLGVFFKLSTSVNAEFKMRIRIKINGKKKNLYSNYIRIRIICLAGKEKTA